MKNCEHDFQPYQSGGSDYNPMLYCTKCNALCGNPYLHFYNKGASDMKSKAIEAIENMDVYNFSYKSEDLIDKQEALNNINKL